MTLSRLERSLLLGQRGPLLSPPDGEGGGGAEPPVADSANPGGQQGSGEESFKPITSEAELAAYKADLRKNIAAELRKTIKKELDDARASDDEAARKKRERDEAEARGEFEGVKQQLETDLSAAKTDVDRLKAENDQLRTALESGLADDWAAPPESVRKFGERAHGEEDVVGRFSFLHDPDTQALVKELTRGEASPGNGHDPKSSEGSKPSREAAITSQEPLYRRF